jgi:hypothetical protein
VSWRVVSGEERQREAPYTYFLPHPDQIVSLRAGDMVKLLFEYDGEVEEYGGERMWVSVDRINGSEFEGELLSEPCESHIAKGERVTFRAEDILDYRYADDRPEPIVASSREFWERCLVDECVLYEGVPVEYIYREEPDMDEEGDKYPDSGWRIRGRAGEATDEELEASKPKYVALGAVLNRDDSWLQLIDAPVGSAFMRNFETGEYEPTR